MSVPERESFIKSDGKISENFSSLIKYANFVKSPQFGKLLHFDEHSKANFLNFYFLSFHTQTTIIVVVTVTMTGSSSVEGPCAR